MFRAAGVITYLLLCSTFACALPLSPEERAGKQIYLTGVGQDSIQARIGIGDMLLPGTSLPCVNCHGRDGRGRPEGAVVPPDITWQRLTKPYRQRLENGRDYPPYTESSLLRAFTRGVDPGDNQLAAAMPRYSLSRTDANNLIAYIRRLEDDHDPGLEDNLLRIGTLLPADGPLAGPGRMVSGLLQQLVEQLNNRGGIHGRKLELVVRDPGPDRSTSIQALQRLVQEDQVFLILAPMAPALSEGLEELAASLAVPVIGSLISPTDHAHQKWVFQALPGLREQMLALGVYANSIPGQSAQRALVVHAADPRQQRLADLLAGRLRELGWKNVQSRSQPNAEQSAVVGQIGTVFFIGSGGELVDFAEASLQADPPPLLLASSDQVGADVLRLPQRLSDRVVLAYAFLPSDWTAPALSLLQSAVPEPTGGERYLALQVNSYVSTMLLFEGLKRIGRDASREALVVSLENLHNFQTGLAPAMSFGPGRRTGALGSHMVRVDLRQQRFQPTGRYVNP
ncbi:ABC transporter substrate-binding protein [Halopseudomonas laoshanensis]|uniref:ABC transporter substrate-binding protein n=1 Tax=Halopseudomonas laoshanensis TaxID=2268758 RepID=UPI003736F4EA